jgi:hypothetical protein
MSEAAARMVLAAPEGRSVSGMWIAVLLVLPLIAPFSAAEAADSVRADDFGIIEELHIVLNQRGQLLDSEQVRLIAEGQLAPVKNGVRPAGSSDALANVDNILTGVSMQESAPLAAIHPAPFQILLGDGDVAPGWVDNVWETLLNITDYVIWVQFQTENDGPRHDSFTTVTFTASLLSLFSGDPLIHDVDVDGDGDDDVRIGISISWDQDDGWGLSGEGLLPTQLWIEPTVQYEVGVIDDSDPMWGVMEFLHVSLFKSFAYSSNPFDPGESYVWVIDSNFTIPPTDWSLDIGFDKFWFDLGDSAESFILALTGGIFGGDETDITVAALAAPYSVQIENWGQTVCPDDYDPAVDYEAESLDHRCRIGVGFGYAHFAPPEDGERDLWELAYIELGLHPVEGSTRLPAEVDVTIRNDNLLSTGPTDIGEKSLTTIEYYADRRCDLWIHFHEDRSNYTEGAGQEYGNVTESLGWLRDLPSGTLTTNEIARTFRMLGSESSPALPGQLPSRLSFILGIKNFTRDTTPNVDDPTLPVNPAYPPDTLLLIRSTQPVGSVDYVSYFQREGVAEDHQRLTVHVEDIPTGLVLYGDFWLGGSDDADVSTDTSDLDFFSRMIDFTILSVVDIFLDVSNTINGIPNSIVDVIGGSAGTSIVGMSVNLEMYTSFESDRVPMALGQMAMSLGSSAHPVAVGDHLLLANNTQLNTVIGRHGQTEPLVPISVSFSISGLKAAHLADDVDTDEQLVQISMNGGAPMRMLFLEHDGTNLDDSSFQIVRLSNMPSDLAVVATATTITYTSSGIPEIVYCGREGDIKQAVVLESMPRDFTMTISDDITWVSEQPIGSITMMISNSSQPQTMEGDHFLFTRDAGTDAVTLSTRMTGLREVGYLSAAQPGIPGPNGRGTAYLVGPGNRTFAAVVIDESQHESIGDGLNAHILLDPMPGTVSLEVPESTSGSSIEVPEFTTESGLAGVAFFLGGFTGFGNSVNNMLGDLVTSVTGGNGSDAADQLSFGMQLSADSAFDLVVDATQGRMGLDEPDWVHGLSITASEAADNHTGFHIRGWLPEMPPSIDVSIGYQNLSVTEQWDVSVNMVGWEPARPEFILQVDGYQGQDLHMTMLGFDTGKPTNMSIDTQTTIDFRSVIPQLTVVSKYEMSQRLGAVHTTYLDRGAQTRYEMLVQNIPKHIDIASSLGSTISIGMSVPVEDRAAGLALDSMMIEMTSFSDGMWWPATVFLHELPGEMNLTMESSDIFDITKEISFQGMPTLSYSSSGEGMDMFIATSGRATNSKGDTLLMAENLASHMSIEPTADFGLRVRSSGDGIGRLYLRQTNMPIQPGVHLVQMEAVGENLKSATIHSYAIGGVYPIIKISDVRGGRMIATARADVTIGSWTFDGRAVLIDAQATSGIPTGSTVSMNGVAADLSLLNMLGFEGSSTHYLLPEPLTSALATGIATLLR